MVLFIGFFNVMMVLMLFVIVLMWFLFRIRWLRNVGEIFFFWVFVILMVFVFNIRDLVFCSFFVMVVRVWFFCLDVVMVRVWVVDCVDWLRVVICDRRFVFLFVLSVEVLFIFVVFLSFFNLGICFVGEG